MESRLKLMMVWTVGQIICKLVPGSSTSPVDPRNPPVRWTPSILMGDPNNCAGYFQCIRTPSGQYRWIRQDCPVFNDGTVLNFDYLKGQCIPLYYPIPQYYQSTSRMDVLYERDYKETTAPSISTTTATSYPTTVSQPSVVCQRACL